MDSCADSRLQPNGIGSLRTSVRGGYDGRTMICTPLSARARYAPVLMSAAPVETPVLTQDPEIRTMLSVPWNVVVWDDPVNLMSYVVYVFRSYFGYSDSKARTLMLEVHHNGRSIVASGTLEEAETHVSALHGYGLWATYERADHN